MLIAEDGWEFIIVTCAGNGSIVTIIGVPRMDRSDDLQAILVYTDRCTKWLFSLRPKFSVHCLPSKPLEVLSLKRGPQNDHGRKHLTGYVMEKIYVIIN